MDRRIEPIGPNELPAGQPIARVHERTREEREAFRRALAKPDESTDDDADATERPSKPAPEMGDREPDEAGGNLDLLG